MQGVGHEDVHVVLQMPGNEADAVRCERLQRIRPRHGLIPALLTIGGVCGARCAQTATDPISADGCDARPVTKGQMDSPLAQSVVWPQAAGSWGDELIERGVSTFDKKVTVILGTRLR
jgi:hypothetical protein